MSRAASTAAKALDQSSIIGLAMSYKKLNNKYNLGLVGLDVSCIETRPNQTNWSKGCHAIHPNGNEQNDIHPNDTQQNDIHPNGIQQNDIHPNDTQQNGTHAKQNDTHSNDTHPNDTQQNDIHPNDTQQNDTQLEKST
jgi:hypothetical protein